MAQAKQASALLKQDISRLEKQISRLLDRIVDATNNSVVTAYETRIVKLEMEKALATEKLSKSGETPHSFDEMFEHACQFLANPCKLWDSGHLALKRMVLKLAFAERITYHRNQGFRTPNLSIPFKLLGDMNMNKNIMVPPHGTVPNNIHVIIPIFSMYQSNIHHYYHYNSMMQ